MDALESLMTRRSPAKLSEPAPSAEALDRALAAAVRAPDHGKLKPWRFLVIDSDARAAFGEVMVDCLKRQQPDANEEMLSREREKPMRAPMIIVAAAKVTPDHPKIPAIEQVLAAASATQNLWLAFHAQGYGVMWKTGAPAYDDGVKAAFGLAPADQIMGFMYVGTIAAPAPDIKRPSAEGFVERWSPPAG